ncbi:hypothetical protein QUF49_02375 [Fictibacillus sp. b24]|uniref:hypothetical protein n=1 Tax=Fictibacillus sp. b24 TaxID=3055863 RepID=UPI0025A2CEC6|nr:hypothetical protein [Fictibacillus sp. b24]MDM5314820.1 hypothetical protein [Fictibacillus sp. b24]
MIGAEGVRLLRDRLAGETLKSETLRMWLTDCPAESEQPGVEINTFKSYKICGIILV